MIITCTNCKTGFVVPEAAIGASGRRVKCSKCQTLWFATLPIKPKVPLTAFTLPDGQAMQGSFNLPSVANVIIGWYLYIMPIFLTLSLAIVYGALFPNKVIGYHFVDSAMLCNKFDICDTDGIKLKDIKLEKVDKNNKKIIVLSYRVANATNIQKYIPIIRIKLLDHEKKLIATHLASRQQLTLKPFHQHLVETKIEDLPDNVEDIEVSIGNRLELALR